MPRRGGENMFHCMYMSTTPPQAEVSPLLAGIYWLFDNSGCDDDYGHLCLFVLSPNPISSRI